jgi:O-antigen/teichoic acid export membrane protein
MKVDLYLVALYLTSAEIAFYSIGVRLAERILMVPTIASTVLFPKLSSTSPTSAADLTAKVCRVTLFASAATATLIILIGRSLISVLYGPSYLPAVGPMYVIVLGIAAVGLMRQLANFLKSIDKHQFSAYILGIGAVVNVGLNVLLIPKYRILGAAFSSLLTYNLQALAFLLVFRHLTQVSWTRIFLIRRTDIQEIARSLKRKSPTSVPAPPIEPATARARR